MARPKKSNGQKLSRFVGLRFKEDDFKKIEESVAELGYDSLSDYIRRTLVERDKQRIEINRKELFAHLDKLGGDITKIGTNINQVAKHANTDANAGRVDPRNYVEYKEHMQEY